MKKIILSLALAFTLHAELINGVAIKVDNEIVTLYEFEKAREQNKFDNKQTIAYLIRQKLEISEAKKLHIRVNNADVIEHLKKMANQHKMTLTQLFEAMGKAEGLSDKEIKNKTKHKF